MFLRENFPTRPSGSKVKMLDDCWCLRAFSRSRESASQSARRKNIMKTRQMCRARRSCRRSSFSQRHESLAEGNCVAISSSIPQVACFRLICLLCTCKTIFLIFISEVARAKSESRCVAGESLPQFSRNCFSEPALGPPTERSWRGGKIGKFSCLKNYLISYFHMSAVNTPNRGKNWCEGKNLFFLRSESANFSWIFSQSNANF